MNIIFAYVGWVCKGKFIYLLLHIYGYRLRDRLQYKMVPMPSDVNVCCKVHYCQFIGYSLKARLQEKINGWLSEEHTILKTSIYQFAPRGSDPRRSVESIPCWRGAVWRPIYQTYQFYAKMKYEPIIGRHLDVRSNISRSRSLRPPSTEKFLILKSSHRPVY